jgi:hypothetical protein
MTFGVYTRQNGTGEIYWEDNISWSRASKILHEYFNQVEWEQEDDEDEDGNTIWRGYIRGENKPVLMAEVW